jgi:serine protease
MFIGRYNPSVLNSVLDTPMRTVMSVKATVPADNPGHLPGGGGGAPRPPTADDDNRSGGLTGFIVVRTTDLASLNGADDAETLLEFARNAHLDDLLRVLDELDMGPGTRLVRVVPPRRLRELEAKAQQSNLPPLRSLLTYWRLDMRGNVDRMEEALRALRSVPGVAAAYPETEFGDPVNPADDTYNGQQGYLDAAPAGIDARWAWTQPNGAGAGIAVVDVERGWTLTHEDYATKSPTLIAGDNRPGSADHGTAVLGEMIADDNTVGVVGVAPSAGPVSCSSYWDAATDTSTDVANAVIAAIDALAAGDVIILEIQTVAPNPFGAPAEYVDDSFDAIRLASALGLVVFEAAGNGSQNLDTITNGGLQILNPASPNFRESGAIIVGAAESAAPHDRAGFSSFGDRVNCYAWGENVVSSGYGDLDDGGGDAEREYTDTFGGTSGATPIVTGAGLIVQAMHQANTGTRLSPAQMRLLLSDPATGTVQGPNVAGNIGVMPDLRAIIEETLGLSADVYLRDNVGDSGAVPSAGAISASPDIIVRPVEVVDPNAAFGAGSGFENSTTLGFEVESGQDNFIYVRMKNRGGADATSVSARVYWSPVSTLVTPDMWTEIGVTPAVDVPADDSLVVTDALVWPSADIPAQGHYCFVGVLDHPADPAPLLPSPTDWDGFRAFIRNQNNVTWRNFNVVDNLDDPSADPQALPFLIANLRDRLRFFDFVIERRVSPNVRVALELPLGLAKAFSGDLGLNVEVDRERRLARLWLPSAPRLVVPRVLLPAGARIECRFLVGGLARHGRPGNMLSIGQYEKDLEVGRVTWRFERERDPQKIG